LRRSRVYRMLLTVNDDRGIVNNFWGKERTSRPSADALPD
jgi:hypothetical protein